MFFCFNLWQIISFILSFSIFIWNFKNLFCYIFFSYIWLAFFNFAISYMKVDFVYRKHFVASAGRLKSQPPTAVNIYTVYFPHSAFVLLLNVVSPSQCREAMIWWWVTTLLWSLSLLLLLRLHFSKAQCGELVQLVRLIALHFQEASLLAPRRRDSYIRRWGWGS